MAFRFETTNERWRHFLADVDPFLDPSEIANPEFVAQNAQEFAQAKEEITQLYNAFMANEIGAVQFATKVTDAVRRYTRL